MVGFHLFALLFIVIGVLLLGVWYGDCCGLDLFEVVYCLVLIVLLWYCYYFAFDFRLCICDASCLSWIDFGFRGIVYVLCLLLLLSFDDFGCFSDWYVAWFNDGIICTRLLALFFWVVFLLLWVFDCGWLLFYACVVLSLGLELYLCCGVVYCLLFRWFAFIVWTTLLIWFVWVLFHFLFCLLVVSVVVGFDVFGIELADCGCIVLSAVSSVLSYVVFALFFWWF